MQISAKAKNERRKNQVYDKKEIKYAAEVYWSNWKQEARGDQGRRLENMWTMTDEYRSMEKEEHEFKMDINFHSTQSFFKYVLFP